MVNTCTECGAELTCPVEKLCETCAAAVMQQYHYGPGRTLEMEVELPNLAMVPKLPDYFWETTLDESPDCYTKMQRWDGGVK